jgi:hypothetical protein
MPGDPSVLLAVRQAILSDTYPDFLYWQIQQYENHPDLSVAGTPLVAGSPERVINVNADQSAPPGCRVCPGRYPLSTLRPI